jgi:hypothetical protein
MNAASRNVDAIERVVRVAIGVVLLAAIFFFDHPMRWIGLIGVAPLVTGLIGWCPLYAWWIRD